MSEKPLSELGGRRVDPKIGFTPDYVNAWNMVSSFLKNYVERPRESTDPDEVGIMKLMIRQMEKVRNYEEYVRAQNRPEEAEDILAKSNPAVVQFLDNLAETYNQEIKAILEKHDWQALGHYWTTISDLVAGRSHL